MAKDILCTLGPASMNDRVIHRLTELGVSMFRINLSHVEATQLEGMITYVKERTEVPLCLDTEGAQIRTGPLVGGPIKVETGEILRVNHKQVGSENHQLNLYPPDIADSLSTGDLVSIDFHSVLAQVTEIEKEHLVLRILNGGVFGANKAVTVDRPIEMPPLTLKDQAALRIGRKHGIDTVALSFANRGTDIDQIRLIAGHDAMVIAKIECLNGLTNLESIAEKSDALLIDRGDLSRELPIERIPSAQKMIINTAKTVGRKVFVATNLLESMVSAPTPTRAEVNDVYNTLLDGADGLVLAAETAVGKHPIGCANMIVKLIREYEREHGVAASSSTNSGEVTASLLVDPHGGILVDRHSPSPDTQAIRDLRYMRASERALIDCEQIACGSFSPLLGFMDRDSVENVLSHHRLPDNTIWTMPILLPIPAQDVDTLAATNAEPVLLTDSDGTPRAILPTAHAYKLDLTNIAQRWYGTASKKHPGVSDLLSGSGWFLAGDVSVFEPLPSNRRRQELSPKQTRQVFAHKGWSRIVGFHTRNVIHRAHEYLISSALNTSNADGVLLSPITGPKKTGDFLPDPILRSYQAMLDIGVLLPSKTVLSSLPMYPRYAGPREAIFTALCRKNMGCSHFIFGRDHAGVGAFYNPDATRELFERVGDLQIEPVFFENIGYDAESDSYVPVSSSKGAIQTISGTEAREALSKNQPLPDWYMHRTVQDQLRADLALGRPIFSE